MDHCEGRNQNRLTFGGVLRTRVREVVEGASVQRLPLSNMAYDDWDQYNVPMEEQVARLERAERMSVEEDDEVVFAYDKEEMGVFLKEDKEDEEDSAEYQPSEESEADLDVAANLAFAKTNRCRPGYPYGREQQRRRRRRLSAK